MPSEGGNAVAQARTRCWRLSMLWLGGGLHTASPGKFAAGLHGQAYSMGGLVLLFGQCFMLCLGGGLHTWQVMRPKLHAWYPSVRAWQHHRAWLLSQAGAEMLCFDQTSFSPGHCLDAVC